MSANEFDVDETIRPQDDFDNYVNKKWKEANPVPDDQVRWGAFSILIDETRDKLKGLLEEQTNDPELRKVIDFYQIGLDEERINQAGINPIKPILEKIVQIKDKNDLMKMIGEIQAMGINPLFDMEAESDAENPDMVIPYITTSGLGLPDRDYYFEDTHEEKRKQYQEYIKDLLILSGEDEDSASIHSTEIFAIEMELAEVTLKNFEKHDPEQYYHKTQFQTLQDWTPSLNWKDFFKITIKKDVPFFSTDKKEFYQRLEKLFTNLGLGRWKTFLKYRVLRGLASYLSKPFEELNFSFYRKILAGQQAMRPRWKRVLAFINVYSHKIGTILGKLYQKRYFPPESKAKMLELVGNLQKSLKQRVLNLEWMTEETKKIAMLKHEAFRAKIGYPDKWPDFSLLDISTEKSYVENVISSNSFDFQYEMKKMFEPTDPDEWFLHPHTINAFFHPIKNEIVFPAGILQFPFFDPNASDPINYGAIGVVIGHEMTHSYDNHGSKFNHKGELKNWWTEEDLAKFNAKTKYYEDKFSTYTVNGININGKLTLGENIADMGGLLTSYDAMQHYIAAHPELGTDMLALDKEFLLSYARIWRNNYRPEMIEMQIQTDPHTPAHWRVNGALSHFPPFHKTFDVKEGDKMYSDDFEKIW